MGGIFTGGPISALVLLGRWDEAIERHDRFQKLPATENAQNLAVHLVEIDCRRGRTAEARARLDGLTALRESDDPQTRSAAELFEAMVLRHEGKTLAALEAAERARMPGQDMSIGFLTVKLALAEALEAALEAGNRGKVDELLRSIEEIPAGARPPFLDAQAHRFRARLSGEPAEFDAAEKRFRALETRFYLAVTQLEHAEQLASQGQVSEAEPLFAAARETFERLGATPYLERAEQGASLRLTRSPPAPSRGRRLTRR